jgi:hypothetical protein
VNELGSVALFGAVQGALDEIEAMYARIPSHLLLCEISRAL